MSGFVPARTDDFANARRRHVALDLFTPALFKVELDAGAFLDPQFLASPAEGNPLAGFQKRQQFRALVRIQRRLFPIWPNQLKMVQVLQQSGFLGMQQGLRTAPFAGFQLALSYPILLAGNGSLIKNGPHQGLAQLLVEQIWCIPRLFRPDQIELLPVHLARSVPRANPSFQIEILEEIFSQRPAARCADGLVQRLDFPLQPLQVFVCIRLRLASGQLLLVAFEPTPMGQVEQRSSQFERFQFLVQCPSPQFVGID